MQKTAAQISDEVFRKISEDSALGHAGGTLGGGLIGATFGVPQGSPLIARVGAGTLGALLGSATGRTLDQFVEDVGTVNSLETGGWKRENAPAFGRILGGIGGAALGAGLPVSQGFREAVRPEWVTRLGRSAAGGVMGSLLGMGIGGLFE